MMKLLISHLRRVMVYVRNEDEENNRPNLLECYEMKEQEVKELEAYQNVVPIAEDLKKVIDKRGVDSIISK